MKAIEFTNKISALIKEFFNTCCDQETFKVSDCQYIECYCIDNGFTLMLETGDHVYIQEFEVLDDSITPLFFQIH